MDWIKKKQTKHNKKEVARSSKLLEIIHTDICRPFDAPSFGREKYFITFIDDFNVMDIFIEKSQSIDALEADVER